jgi:hypothetical protein
MEINGLPLHPLVVHAAVVFGPLGALGALAYLALPSWRDRLRWPMLGLALLAALAIVAAYLTGRNFVSSRPELAQLPGVDTHRHRARLLLLATMGFSVTAVAASWLHPRPGALRAVAGGLLGVSAVAVLVLVVLTGDAGARAVWGQ